VSSTRRSKHDEEREELERSPLHDFPPSFPGGKDRVVGVDVFAVDSRTLGAVGRVGVGGDLYSHPEQNEPSELEGTREQQEVGRKG